MTRHIPLIILAAALSVPATAAAQDRPNVGEALKKAKKTNLKKKPTFKKLWTKAGTCHERRSDKLSFATPYKARCTSTATRHASEMFSCEGRHGDHVDIRVGGTKMLVYRATRFVCTRNAAGKRYQIGYDPGQSGTLTSNTAADFVCGCFEPPGGEQCDEGFAGLCDGAMASLEAPTPRYEGLDALAYVVTHAFEIDWARTLGFAAA
jgi:hypothetical protein